jgi:hypothetical protein
VIHDENQTAGIAGGLIVERAGSVFLTNLGILSPNKKIQKHGVQAKKNPVVSS